MAERCICIAIKTLVMIMGLFGFANMWIAVFADTGVTGIVPAQLHQNPA